MIVVLILAAVFTLAFLPLMGAERLLRRIFRE